MNKFKKYIKIFFLSSTIGFIIGSSILLYFYYESYKNFPSLSHHIPHIQESHQIRIIDRNNQEIPYSFKNQKITVNYSSIPKNIIKTLIGVEDKEFFFHKGVNLISTLRSILLLPFFLILKKRPWGASTITQQLVRNLFLNQKYSYLRKIREIILSFRIEKELTKEEIITSYLNLIYFGKGVYGIATAAKVFFNKTLHQLDPEEVAFLIGVIKNPNFSLEVNHDEAKHRRNYVLEIMTQNKIISPEVFNEIIHYPIKYHNGGGNDRSFIGQHFIHQVQNIYKELSDKKSLEGENITIKTTMDLRIQKILQKIIKEEIERLNDNIHEWYGNLTVISEDKLEMMNLQEKIKFISKYKNPNYGANIMVGLMGENNQILLSNGAKVAIENYGKYKNFILPGAVFFVKKYQDLYYPYQKPLLEASAIIMNGQGEVLAIVGSHDYQISSFNRAAKTQIQVSSMMKVLIYGFMLENGIQEDTPINDEPVTVQYHNTIWTPKNWDGQFKGPMTIGQGLILSRNCSVVNGVIGIEEWSIKLKKYLKRFGIHNVVPSFIIGSNEMTLDHFGRSIGVIANGGYKVDESLFIKKITQNNNILMKFKNSLDHRILDESITDKIYELFCKNNTHGLGWSIGIPKNFATKSGTANENKRINFVAFEKNGLIIIVSIAQDNNKQFKAVSNKAGIIVKKIIEYLTKDNILKEYQLSKAIDSEKNNIDHNKEDINSSN